MKETQMINNNGNKQKEAFIVMLDDGGEILTHYGTPVAGYIDETWVRTEDFYSTTTSKVINMYLGGTGQLKVPQEFLNKTLMKG